MTSCYFVNYHGLDGYEEEVAADIQKINPDIIICLCLEEFDYCFLFKKFISLIQPYLINNNKIIKFIVPFIDKSYTPENVIFEESYGGYHWSWTIIDYCIENNIRFQLENVNKLFTNYNNNAKFPRAMLVDTLIEKNILSDGIVTLIKPNMKMPNGTYYTYKYHDGSKLVDEEDFVLNSCDKFVAWQLPKRYLTGLVDIVSESTYETGQFFITEKTAKPLAVLKPFLVFGPPNIHKFLKDKFQVEFYDEFFDYSFDKEENLQARINGIVDNLLRLKQKSFEELKDMYTSIENKLITNRENYLKVREEKRYIPEGLKFVEDKNILFYGHVNASILGLLGVH